MINYITKPQTVKHNIWKYTLLSILDKRMYAAILSLFYLSKIGVEEYHIGIIIALGCLVSFIFEIPSGFISDKIGHKKTLVLSRVFMSLSTFFYLISTDLKGLIIGIVFFNLAVCCMSGTGTAFIYDTLKALNKEHRYAKIMGKITALSYLIPPVILMLTSYLATFNYNYILTLVLFFDVITIFLALSLVSINTTDEQKAAIKETNLKKVISFVYSTGLAPYILLAALASGILLGIRGYVDPFQLSVGANVALFGIFLAISRVLSSLISFYSEQIKSIFNINSFYAFKITILSALFILLGFATSWQSVVVIMILINAINLGLLEVENNFILDIIGKSNFKATLFSIKGQINQIFQAATTLGLGFAIGLYSYNLSFMVLGVIFMLSCSGILLYTKVYK